MPEPEPVLVTQRPTVVAEPCTFSRRALLVSVSVLALLSPASALAHGREPAVGQIAFHPTAREHFVLRGTWALLTTRDDGATFTWTCAVSAGFDRTSEDPPTALTESGHVALGTFDGLRRSSADGCEYLDGPPEVRGAFVIDVQADPHDPRAIWVVRSPGDRANSVLVSRDEGESFEVMSSFEPGVLLERVRVSPSDAMRVYVTGAIPRTDTEPRHAFFFRSIDGGRTFEPTEIPLLPDERNAHVVAIDPDDAGHALVRMTRAVTDEAPERLLLTEDGGQTFRSVLEAREIVSVAFGHDGTTAWAGSWYGGLFRSDDGGATWAPLDADLRVRCLAEREASGGGSELFVCVDELFNDYAVARSYDRGATLEPMWGFADVTNDIGCDRCTPVGAVCPSYWPDVLYDLAALGGVDGGPAPGPNDAGPVTSCEGGVPFDTGVLPSDAGPPPASPATCACAAASARAPSSWLWIAFAAISASSRRRRTRASP